LLLGQTGGGRQVVQNFTLGRGLDGGFRHDGVSSLEMKTRN